MSSQHVAPTPAPDDDDYSPEPTRRDRVMAELARRTTLIDAEARAIAEAQARQAELLVELQDWSEDPQVCAQLHGNPESVAVADHNAATMTEDQARAAAYSRWDDRQIARRTIVSETACLLRMAERTIERMLDQSLWLLSFPDTLEALRAGDISYRHATVLIDQARTLPAEDQHRFEQEVLPAAKSLPVGRFRDKARRLRERQHPESIVTRNRDALAERRAYWEPDADGMAWLHWNGTSEQVKAVWERIDSMAHELRSIGDPVPAAGDRTGAATGAGSGAAFGLAPTADAATDTAAAENDRPGRTLEQLRADVTAGLLLNGVTPSGLGAGVRGTVMITVSAETLLRRSDEPAILEGYGPISPEAARQIAADAPYFTRLLTHPETGVVLSLGKTRYRNTKAMRKWLRMRDETCRFPGCAQPAMRSDVDHTQDWADGGTTDQDNLAHLCEAHHRLKHLSQWRVTQEPGGILLWTSPGKRSYRTDPANPIGPARPNLPTITPRTRKRPAKAGFLIPPHQPTLRPSPPTPENPPF
jgi:hypothetical protein